MANNNGNSGKRRNLVVLTARVVQKPVAGYTAEGQFWARARLSLGMGKNGDGSYKPSLFFDASAFGKDGDETVPTALAELHKGDLVTLTGSLRYKEFERKDGGKGDGLGLIVQKVAPFEDGGKFSNFAILTVRLVAGAEQNVGASSGQPYTTARAFLPMGKDQATGAYRPSLFLNVVAFSKDGDTTAPDALAQFGKGDWMTARGRLAYEEYARQDGATGHTYKLIARQVEPFAAKTDEAAEAETEAVETSVSAE